MREFKIYGVVEENTESYKKLVKKFEDNINNSADIIRYAKECNEEFVKTLKKELENEENNIYMGTIVETLKSKLFRNMTVRGIYEGKWYEAQVDLLERKFTLQEIDF
jgi:vacuolar-type H+-ATPase subunit E/Vma4